MFSFIIYILYTVITLINSNQKDQFFLYQIQNLTYLFNIQIIKKKL